MGKQEYEKEKNIYRWFIPLIVTIPLPLLVALMLAVLPPFPYVRPWFVTIITSVIGFEFWAFGIGYWVQETELKRLCTGRTIAVVLG